MVNSAKSLAKNNVEIKLYLNDDDPVLDQYKNLIADCHIVVGPDRSPGYSWNMLAEEATNDYYFLAGDDVNFVTRGWDKIITDAFSKYPDKIACVYPTSPGLKKKKNPHFCVHRNWIDALGYFVPPQFWHWYVDTWTAELARSVGRYELVENCVVEIQKDIKDETTNRVHKMCLRERDHHIWHTTSTRWLDADKTCLSNYIRNFK
jgi:hypothetical protein